MRIPTFDSKPYTISMAADPRLLQGIALFNEQYFFDAHDVWEDLWTETRGPDRLFFQSLIHAAVALYHWRTHNRPGARNVYGFFLRRSAGYPDTHLGLRFAKLRRDMADFFSNLDTRDYDASTAPRIDTEEGIEIPPAQPVEEM